MTEATWEETDPSAESEPELPPLTIPEIMRRLEEARAPDLPREALRQAISLQEAITPELLRVLEDVAADPSRYVEKALSYPVQPDRASFWLITDAVAEMESLFKYLGCVPEPALPLPLPPPAGGGGNT